jgi:glycosyltransferase involved in cell wall biosynthesis
VLEVVIPAYNAAPFLRETLESLAAQTRPADLVTIVDDRSTDGTGDLARSLVADLSPRLAIRVLDNAGPQGPAAARNTALRASTADVIALMDSDDLAEPHHHRTLLDLIETGPDIVLGFGNSLVFRGVEVLIPDMHAKSGISGFPAEELGPDRLTLGERMFEVMLGAGMFSTSACAFRREAAREAGLFDETLRYSEDTDLFLRLTLLGRFAFARAIITRKRVHGSNLVGHSKLHFCRGTALALSRLADRAAAGDPVARHLSAPRRAALAEGLRRAMYGWLYAASWETPRVYREAAAAARHAGLGRMARDPKHLARLLIAPVWRPETR